MAKAWAWLPALAGAAIGALALALWPTPVWPDPDVRLVMPSAELPPGFHKRRIVIDPGHGARANTGNRSAFCVDEQDFTLSLAELLAARLTESGGFQVRLARRQGELVEYADRIERAEAWEADALISLHSDVRGRASDWEPSAGLRCKLSRTEPGFAVIFSDDAEPELVEQRRELARQVGRQLGRARFLPYDGASYAPDYEPAGESGVFVDRRERRSRIFVLHRPKLPSVLIETHNAIHDREAVRWEEPETREAFARAVVGALITVFASRSEAHAAALRAQP